MIPYRLALVTGATSGLGREICSLFAGKGISLIISGRDREELNRAKNHLSSQVSVASYAADLSTLEGRNLLIKAIHEHAPDLIINNAGFGLYAEALTYTTEEQSDILKVNGQAVLELSLEAARTLISKGKRGIVLNVSSAAAFQIFPSLAVYAASKAFVTQFSRAFDFEVKSYGVRVLTICPGMIATEFQKRAGGERGNVRTGVMSPAFVAEQIWWQIERQKQFMIVDWKYRLLTWISAFLPKSLTAYFNKRIIDERIDPRTLIKVEK